MDSRRLRSIMNGQDRSIFGGIVRSGLACLAFGYRTVIFIRNMQFNMGLRPVRRLGRLTVSVGNLTTGGTGKTPVAMDLAQRLLAMGVHPAVLLRGYKADVSVGSDEACLIRESLGSSIAVGWGPSRVVAARNLLQGSPEIGAFLLDDGFQHRQVDRNLDIVLIDATEPFGYGHLLPRGMLREPISSIRRAHAVIVTRADQVTPAQRTLLDEQIQGAFGKPPIAHVIHRWEAYVDFEGTDHSLRTLSQSRVMGVCGIGNPDAFARSLKEHTKRVVEMRGLPDHHRYDSSQLQDFLREAQDHRVDAVVTTHKDMVKWRPLLNQAPLNLPIYYPKLSVVYLDGWEAVGELLLEKIAVSR